MGTNQSFVHAGQITAQPLSYRSSCLGQASLEFPFIQGCPQTIWFSFISVVEIKYPGKRHLQKETVYFILQFQIIVHHCQGIIAGAGSS